MRGDADLLALLLEHLGEQREQVEVQRGRDVRLAAQLRLESLGEGAHLLRDED